MNLGFLLLVAFAFGGSVNCLVGFDTIIITPVPIPTPIPTPTPTPTSTASTCVIPLPTTTLICKSRHEACKQCNDNQTCVQIGKDDNGVYKCPIFECQDCPEPVCDPPCGCKEECAIVKKGRRINGYVKHDSCPIAKCKALPVCLSCPPVSCDSVRCEENFECKVKGGSCNLCPSVSCEPKACLECATEPITCMCPRGKECKVTEGSCYKCPSVSCVDVPDPCSNCKGECSVSSHPNCGESCPPQRLCVEECRQCSPFLPNWKCKNPRSALYVPRTCSTCSEYRCINDCKNCENHEPKCECENEEDCIRQPRTCDQCETFYCKKECVKDGPGEECKCEDSSLCVYRPGNCFTRSYYECVPPGKGEFEPIDLSFGRQEAKKRNFK